jgi:hypothetical protein
MRWVRAAGSANEQVLSLRLQFTDDEVAQGAQNGQRKGIERSRDGIDQAKRSYLLAAFQFEWRAGVEPDVRLTDDQRVIGETFVQRGIRHDGEITRVNRMATKRDAARRFADWQAGLRLEPLAITIDKRHQHDGDIELFGCKFDDTVEAFFWRCVEQQETAQRGQSIGFVCR